MNGFEHSSLLKRIQSKNEQEQSKQYHDKSKVNQQSISYGQCSKGGYHFGELLNCVCIDESCSQNELICSICEQEQHSGHQVVPLKIFLDSLQNIDDKRFTNDANENQFIHNYQNTDSGVQNDQSGKTLSDQHDWAHFLNNSKSSNSKINNRDQFAQYLEEIERQHQITIKYFQDYQVKIIEGFNEITTKINSFYKAIKSEIQTKQYLEETCFQNVLQSLTNYSSAIQQTTANMSSSFSESNMKDIVNTIQSEHRNPRKNKTTNNKDANMGKNINEVLKIIGFDQNNGYKSYYKLDLDNVVQLCESRQQKLIASKDADPLLVQLKALVSKCDSLYGEIPELTVQKTSSIKSQGLSSFLKFLRFSDKFKGTSIQIKSPSVAHQTQNESSGQRFCLLEPNLPLNSRLRWGFKIKNLVGWIGIGICMAQVIKGFNYQFKYSKIGHGSYLLSGNGYTWSHSKSAQNSQNKSFHFVSGDTIYLEFDPIEKKIKFLKGKTNESYVLEIDFVPTDEIVPCVNLCSSGDEIELILNEQELTALKFQSVQLPVSQ